jgi:hypothetical protein
MLRNWVTGGFLAWLDRSERVLRGLHQLRGYHLAPIALLPSVLELLSDLPTPSVQVRAIGRHQCAVRPPRRSHGEGSSRIEAATPTTTTNNNNNDSNKNDTKKRRGPPDYPPAMIRPRRDSPQVAGFGGSGGLLGASRHPLGKLLGREAAALPHTIATSLSIYSNAAAS